MSLEQIVADRQIDHDPDKRILVLDIERMKGQAVIEFWDLSDFKNRRIHPDDVTIWPRTICAAWQWLDVKRVEFAAEWDGSREEFLERVWHAYDQAAVVIGHNLAAFDTKKLQSEWWLMGLPKPSPWITIDTLKVARSELGMESNTLDSLCKRAGIAAKTDRYDVEVARRACAGSKKDQRQIKGYNIGDIGATKAFYLSLLGRIPNHPHLRIAANQDEIRCNNCQRDNLREINPVPGPSGRIYYRAWRCQDCGTVVQDTKQHARTARTKGAR